MSRRKRVEASDEKFEATILHLENGGTKKAACEILGIAYNTTRLGTLIEDWSSRKEQDKVMRAKKRKLAISDQEIVSMITDYLSESPISDIANSHYRSTAQVKGVLERYGALFRSAGSVDPLYPPMLPEQSIAESFEVGEFAWSAKYDCIVKIAGIYKGAYRILIMGGERQRFQAYQPAHELGSLKHLIALGVDPERVHPPMMDEKEVIYLLNEAVKKGNKRDAKK